MTVDILLATYNGGAHLREQLDSIINQTNKDWRLVIRDDGSTDNTLDILHEYEEKINTQFGKGTCVIRSSEERYDRQKLKKKIPVLQNFSELMKFSKMNNKKAEYAMPCDQDDIWFPDKIDRTLAEMHRLEEKHRGEDIPLMVHSDAKTIAADGQPLSDSIKRDYQTYPALATFKTDLVCNVAQGCTIMMNRKLLEMATPVPDEARMHDAWISLVASAAGDRSYMNEPTMNYRLHDSNVTAGKHNRSLAVRIKRTVTTLDEFYEQAVVLKRRLNNEIPEQKRHSLDRFLEIGKLRQPFRGVALYQEGYTRGPAFKNAALFVGSRVSEEALPAFVAENLEASQGMPPPN